MIGHMPLVALRIAQKRPKAVWIWVGTRHKEWASSWHLYSDLLAHPWITVEPQDRIPQLDLRFLVGLQVHIDGEDTVDRIFDTHLACMKAGVRDVFTYHNGELIHDKGEPIAVS